MHQIYRSISAEWVCDLFSCSCLINQTIMFLYDIFCSPLLTDPNYYLLFVTFDPYYWGMASVCLLRGKMNVLRNGNKVSIDSNESIKTKPKINHLWTLRLFMRAEWKHRMDCNMVPEFKIGFEYLWSRED